MTSLMLIILATVIKMLKENLPLTLKRLVGQFNPSSVSFPKKIYSREGVKPCFFLILILFTIVRNKFGVLKNFVISTGKHLRWSLFLTKLHVFSNEYCEFFKKIFFCRTSLVVAYVSYIFPECSI